MPSLQKCRDAVDALVLVHDRFMRDGDNAALAKMWHIVLSEEGVTDAEMQHALGALLKSPGRWPTPAHVIEIVTRERHRISQYYDPPDIQGHTFRPGELRKLWEAYGVEFPNQNPQEHPSDGEDRSDDHDPEGAELDPSPGRDETAHDATR